MAVNQITFTDKVLGQQSPQPEEKKLTFQNINEVKNTVNNNANELQTVIDDQVEEAPIDGTQYARQDASWAAVQPSVGAGEGLTEESGDIKYGGSILNIANGAPDKKDVLSINDGGLTLESGIGQSSVSDGKGGFIPVVRGYLGTSNVLSDEANFVGFFTQVNNAEMKGGNNYRVFAAANQIALESSFDRISIDNVRLTFRKDGIGTIEFNASNMEIQDDRAFGNRRGLEYTADISDDFSGNSLVNKIYADKGQLRVVTVGTLPAVVAGEMIFVSDESGGAVTAFGDGTNWRRTTDRSIVS